MNRRDTELSYRRSSIEGASPIGLVIALYDTLAGDLRRAASALRNDDIEKRCAELNHATIVIGQLEDWVDKVNGGDLAQNLSAFYSFLRARLLEAAIAKSATLLEAQIELLLQVRSAWQQKDMISLQAAPAPSGVVPAQIMGAFAPKLERMAFSLSA